MRDWPGLGGHSCDPQILLPFESAFTVVTFPAAGPHLSLGFGEDEDGGGGGGVLSSWGGVGGWEGSAAPQGQMTDCPVLPSSSFQPAPPLLP